MPADRTHWSECWRVHHECAVAEVERLRAQVAAEHWLRAKRLEAIVRELVALGPSDTYGSCLLCGTDHGAPHESDCLWLRARQEVGDVG